MTANDLKLYHAAASPNSHRVRIFMPEKGVTVPLVPVISVRAHNTPMPTALSIRDALCPHSVW
jgi:glutathione S-transferase